MPSPKLTLFIRRGLLEPELCATLMERIDAVRRPSTIAEKPSTGWLGVGNVLPFRGPV